MYAEQEWKEAGDQKLEATFHANTFKPYVINSSTRAEMWQGKLRVKSTVTGVTPLDFREGGAELLRLIRAYNSQAPEDVVRRGRVKQVGVPHLDDPTLDTFDHQVSQKRPRSQKERLVAEGPQQGRHKGNSSAPPALEQVCVFV